MLALLLIGTSISGFNIRPVGADGTITIRADGSIDPPTVPISTADNVTYALTGNITSSGDGIVIQRDNIVVDGHGYTLQGGSSGMGLNLTGRMNVTIQNMQVESSGFGVFLLGSSGILIDGNSITNNSAGISITSSSNNTISNNNITANDNDAIVMGGGSSDRGCYFNNVSGNNIVNNGDGISLAGYASNNSISGNNVTNNEAGILLNTYANYNDISRNNVTANSQWGIFVGASSFNNFCKNNVTNSNYGFWIQDCSNNSFSENNVKGNNVLGIWLRYSSNNTFSMNNVTTNSRYGFLLSYSSNNTLAGNTMANNQYCFSVGGSGFSDFVNYVDASNTVDGKPVYYWISKDGMTVPLDAGYVTLINCTNMTVKDLNLADNGDGVLLVHTTDSRITENNLTNNGDGICLRSSSNNTISANNIANNGLAMWINSSTANTVYHNNFIGNSQQAFNATATTNTWDDGYPSGGNYWSDYNGTDLYSGPYQNKTGSDGIGDTPYTIDARNVDYYPLTAPYETTPPEIHILSPQNQTYDGRLVPLNFTVYDYSPISWMGYSLDGAANVTVVGNITLTLADGSHYVSVYANDTFGNMGSSGATYFAVDTTVHDLAVTNVTVSNSIVEQGEPVIVHVTVENLGDNSETFNVTVYANATAVSTLRNIVLSAHASTTVNITWNTYFLAGGNYTVSAYASPVPGETSTTDNTFTDGTLQIIPNTPTPTASGGTRKYVC